MKSKEKKIEKIEKLAGMIQCSLLKANVTESEIKQLCKDAIKYKFGGVCVNPFYIKLCKEILTKAKSKAKVIGVVGYPLGCNKTETKIFEARQCINDGADELDVVMNISAFKSGKYGFVKEEIKKIVSAAKAAAAKAAKKDIIVKIIIETGYLTREEIIKACKIVKQAGADFVKSGTGWSKPAEPQTISLMRKVVGKGKGLGIKAAGGIRTASQMLALIKAGANIIGTSSGKAIIEELKKLKNLDPASLLEEI